MCKDTKREEIQHEITVVANYGDNKGLTKFVANWFDQVSGPHLSIQLYCIRTLFENVVYFMAKVLLQLST